MQPYPVQLAAGNMGLPMMPKSFAAPHDISLALQRKTKVFHLKPFPAYPGTVTLEKRKFILAAASESVSSYAIVNP
jgi:hypothetical protein